MLLKISQVTEAPHKSAFPNYLQTPQQGPAVLWWFLRLATLGVVAGLASFLVRDPEQGLKLFWTVAMPILPLFFAFAPGFWRQVCPMAFANQVPRTFGFSQGKSLPKPVKAAAFLIASTTFFALVSLRPFLFNVSAGGTLALIGLALSFAFIGGVVFSGRSGWCGTLCPLAPIQRVYGLGPIVKVRNGYCDTCLGCQKNCYDFNPRAAFVADFQDKDPFYLAQRRLFTAALPGFVIGFFAYGRLDFIDNLGLYYAFLLGSIATSVGLYTIIQTYTRIPEVHLSAVSGQIALVTFYALVGEPMAQTVASFLPFGTPPVWADEIISGGVFACSVSVLVRHFRTERAFAVEKATAAAPKLTVNLSRIPGVASGAPEVVETSSGQTMATAPDTSLLETFENSGLKLEYGCRMGVCGADPIAIVEGEDNLSEPTAEELASLRRHGLEGRARLACVCKVRSGKAVVDLSTDPKTLPPPKDQMPAKDLALVAGISSVVIVGNGAAGTTVATELRRLSPSLSIDVVTDEPYPFYNRMGIARLIHRNEGIEELFMLDAEAFKQSDITLHRGTRVERIETEAQALSLSSGKDLPYDRLVLATGAHAYVPEIEGRDLPGVFVLRTAADAKAIRAHVEALGASNPKAVVVGGGVLGVEAADALARLKLQTVLLQRSDRLMQRELDKQGAEILATFLKQIGIRTQTEAKFKAVLGQDRVEAVEFADGSKISTDVVLICAGVTPDIELARAAGLTTNRGIIVNNSMQSSIPSIYAVGDAAETEPASPALWPVGTHQATLAASAILQDDARPEPSPIYVRLKHDGICVLSFGTIVPGDGVEDIQSTLSERLMHRRLFVRDNCLLGAIVVGPPGSDKFVLPYLNGATIPEATLEQWRAEVWG